MTRSIQQTNQSQTQTGSSPTNLDPYKWHTVLVALMVTITPLVAIGAVVAGMPTSNGPTNQLVVSESHRGVPLQRVSAQTIYKDTCMICHGDDGQGIPRLGKPLRNSAYIQETSDESIFDLIAQGRTPDNELNTTGTLMPARGAQNMGDGAIHKVIAHLREMQDSSQPFASMDAWIVEKTAETVVVSSAILEHPGREIFVASCSACHGPNGEGIEGLGKPFTTSEFVTTSSDKELMTMIKMGRPVWDAANTTGLDMPSKGGNPAITDDQLSIIISYIRSVSTLTE